VHLRIRLLEEEEQRFESGNPTGGERPQAKPPGSLTTAGTSAPLKKRSEVCIGEADWRLEAASEPPDGLATSGTSIRLIRLPPLLAYGGKGRLRICSPKELAFPLVVSDSTP
jgi:hypothetical protein